MGTDVLGKRGCADEAAGTDQLLMESWIRSETTSNSGSSAAKDRPASRRRSFRHSEGTRLSVLFGPDRKRDSGQSRRRRRWRVLERHAL